MTSREYAERCMQLFQNVMFFGFELCINWANPSKPAKSGFRPISIEPAGSEIAIQQAKAPKRRAFWANLDLPSVPSQMSLSSAQDTGMHPFILPLRSVRNLRIMASNVIVLDGRFRLQHWNIEALRLVNEVLQFKPPPRFK